MANRNLWVFIELNSACITFEPKQNNRVWLECDGENPADRENIGKMTYYPTNGVSANFYPYLNQKGYLSPVVFAHLDNPRRKKTLKHPAPLYKPLYQMEFWSLWSVRPGLRTFNTTPKNERAWCTLRYRTFRQSWLTVTYSLLVDDWLEDTM